MDWLELGKSIAPLATIGSMVVGVTGIVIAATSLRAALRTNRAKFVYDLTESFLKDTELKQFWYRLDYDKISDRAWTFSLSNFRHSTEERLVDTLLYKFVVVGHMLKNKSISLDDIEGLFTICRQTFRNSSVQEYLRFHKLDFWCAEGIVNTEFECGLKMFESVTMHLLKTGRAGTNEYAECKRFIKELDRIPYDILLQQEIAGRIGYPQGRLKAKSSLLTRLCLVFSFGRSRRRLAPVVVGDDPQ
jgi:hypothetical protein